MRFPRKPQPPELPPIALRRCVINGQQVTIKVLPPRPAHGAFWAESEAMGFRAMHLQRTTRNPC